MCYPGLDPGPVMPKVPVNSRDLNQVSMGMAALGIRIPRKNYHPRCVELVSAYRGGDK